MLPYDQTSGPWSGRSVEARAFLGGFGVCCSGANPNRALVSDLTLHRSHSRGECFPCSDMSVIFARRLVPVGLTATRPLRVLDASSPTNAAALFLRDSNTSLGFL